MLFVLFTQKTEKREEIVLVKEVSDQKNVRNIFSLIFVLKKDTICAWKERPAGKQFSHDASNRPNVDSLIVMHPIEHYFRRTIPSTDIYFNSIVFYRIMKKQILPRCNISRHFIFCRSCQTKIQYFQFAIFVHGNIAGL